MIPTGLRAAAVALCLIGLAFIFAAVVGHPVPRFAAGIAILLVAGLLVRLARHLANEGRDPDAKDRVTFDDDGVTRHLVDGRTESVRWDELTEVTIVTTSNGPFAEDVYWMLLGQKDGDAARHGCLIPSQSDGIGELLSRLQKLPGFDNRQVIAAMGSTDHAHFVCWRRPPRSPVSPLH